MRAQHFHSACVHGVTRGRLTHVLLLLCVFTSGLTAAERTRRDKKRDKAARRAAAQEAREQQQRRKDERQAVRQSHSFCCQRTSKL